MDHLVGALYCQPCYAVQVCAERIRDDLRANSQPEDGIFLVETTLLERADYSVSAFDQGGQLVPLVDAADSTYDMSPHTRAKVLQQLQLHTSDKPFSLIFFIAKRLSLPRADEVMPPKEHDLLTDL